MQDSTETGTELPKKFFKTLNQTLKDYFDVRRDRAANKLKLEKKQAKLTEKFALMDEPLAKLEDELAETLRALLIPNKARLLTGRLRSFKTNYGEVFFAKKKESTSIKDPKGLEKQARKDGNLRTLGKFTRTWKPVLTAVVEFMATKPEAITKKYEPFLSHDGGYDELSVKPNEPYIKEYDPNRLSVSKVPLGPAPDSQDEQSPDA